MQFVAIFFITGLRKTSVVCVCSVEWLVATSSTSSTIASFKLGLSTMDTAIEVTVQWQMKRARGARVLER
jgi:hypothetical protein